MFEESWLEVLLFTATCSSFVCLGISVAFLGPSLLKLHELLSGRSAVTQEGWLFSVGGVAYFVGATLNSILPRQANSHCFEALLLTICLVVSGVSQALLPLARRQWLLGTLLFMTRLGAGSIDVSGNSIIASAHNSAESWMQSLHAFFSVGAFLAPLVLAFSLRRTANEIYLGFAIFSAVVVLSLSLILFYALTLRKHSNMIQPKSQAAPEAAAEPVQTHQVVLSAKERRLYGTGLFRGNGNKSRSREFIDHGARVFLVLLVFASYAGCEVSLGGWLAVYARETGRIGEELARADDVPTLFWAAMMVSRLLAIWISLRLSATQILGVCVGASLMLWLVASWMSSHLYGMAAGLGLAMGPAYASQMSVAMGLFGDRSHCTTEVAAWATIGSTLGEALLPWLAGLLMSRIGLEWFIYTGVIYTGIWIVCAASLMLLLHATKLRQHVSSPTGAQALPEGRIL